jgi:chemotaxis protein MotB
MARKKRHEDHINHEAWAIPYGDLITLLLAFFVVMYAMSSVNQGKFRVLSDSLNEAFHGAPTSVTPIHVGEPTRGTGAHAGKPRIERPANESPPPQMLEAVKRAENPMVQQLKRVADELEGSMQSLINSKLVAVRRHEFWLEVEINSDILFQSGDASLPNRAIPALDALAATLIKHPNPVRVEGHTDNRPISNRLYPSNWELSAARAASVVHRFAQSGVSPERLSVLGFGEYRPSKPNATNAGRAANRRVIIVILAGEGAPTPEVAAEMAAEANQAGAPVALPPLAAEGELAQRVGTETAPVPVTLNAGAGIPAQE